MAITLLELRTGAQQRADMETSSVVETAEWNAYINGSIAELHDLLVGAYSSDYSINEYEFQTVNGQADYALPAAFYKLRGVDTKLTAGDNWFTLRPFNFNERNRFDQSTTWALMTGPAIRYRLVGSNIKFSPAPDGSYTVKLWYIPVATKLTADSDELNDLNQYAEYVMVDAAIKALVKQELDVQALMIQKAALAKRITDMAQNRDADQPESVSDIYAENDDYYFFRGS